MQLNVSTKSRRKHRATFKEFIADTTILLVTPILRLLFCSNNTSKTSQVALHVNATNGGIHNVGVFLPWHRCAYESKFRKLSTNRCRLTVWTYETVLRDECGYTGAQPYWDYTLDTPEKGGHFKSSPVLDPIYGFGGDGGLNPAKNSKTNGPSTCVFGGCDRCVDGPFAKYKIYLGPGNSMKSNPRCLTRQINGQLAETTARPQNLEAIMKWNTFEQFQVLQPGNIGGNNRPSPNGFALGYHSIGHQGLGGEVTSSLSTPRVN
jgi:tyrosinase